jgi:hypothetical protein
MERGPIHGLEGAIEDREMLFLQSRCTFNGIVLVDVIDDLIGRCW